MPPIPLARFSAAGRVRLQTLHAQMVESSLQEIDLAQWTLFNLALYLSQYPDADLHADSTPFLDWLESNRAQRILH